MKINRPKSSKLAKTLVLVGVLVIIVGVYLVVAWQKHLPPFSSLDKTYAPGEQTLNLDRTDTEKKASDDLTKNPEKKLENPQTDTPSTPNTNPSSGKQSANVLVTNAGVFNGKASASGFVTNIVEEGGLCDYVFTNGTQTISKQSQTLVNATSTTCKTVSFSADELTSGTWKVHIKYTSAASEGVSPDKEFAK